jgi:hypothetical protein
LIAFVLDDAGLQPSSALDPLVVYARLMGLHLARSPYLLDQHNQHSSRQEAMDRLAQYIAKRCEPIAERSGLLSPASCAYLLASRRLTHQTQELQWLRLHRRRSATHEADLSNPLPAA